MQQRQKTTATETTTTTTAVINLARSIRAQIEREKKSQRTARRQSLWHFCLPRFGCLRLLGACGMQKSLSHATRRLMLDCPKVLPRLAAQTNGPKTFRTERNEIKRSVDEAAHTSQAKAA